jgi:hypothetical protein
MVTGIKHIYEVRPRKDHRGVDPISDALPFGRQWYEQASDANRKSDDGVTFGPIKIVVTRRESVILKTNATTNKWLWSPYPPTFM